MKLLLINTNPIVQKLVKLSAEKVGLSIIEADSLNQLQDISEIQFIFIDDKSFSNNLKREAKEKIPQAKLGYIYSKNSEKEGGFDIYVQKPFLPTDFVELLKNHTIGMDRKDFATPTPEIPADDILQENTQVDIQDSIQEEIPLEEEVQPTSQDDGELDNLEETGIGTEEDMDLSLDDISPDLLPPEGDLEAEGISGLEDIEGLDDDIHDMLGGDEEKATPDKAQDDLDLGEDLLEVDGLQRPAKKEPEATQETTDDLDLDSLDLDPIAESTEKTDGGEELDLDLDTMGEELNLDEAMDLDTEESATTSPDSI
ncbi:hypothetical protein CCZ01_09120, partial [Helicobacter monodelphidis]